MSVVTTTISYTHNGETTVVAESADAGFGWPDLIAAAEHSSRLAVNKLEEKLENESSQRAG